MGTAKRERQRQNRDKRIAEAELAAKKAETSRRIKRLTAMATAAVLVAVGLFALPRIRNRGTPATEAPDNMECPDPDGSSGRRIDFNAPQPVCIDPDSGYTAVFDTSEGEIRFDLHTATVPSTVNNFVTLARWGYYDGTGLFRTDPSIDIIQGGSPHTNNAADPGPGYTIADEPQFEVDPATNRVQNGPYRYQPGQLVMARTEAPNSASAQFFITTGPNSSFLDGQGTYVIFGTTDEAGLAVAQSIMGLHEENASSLMGGAPSREVTVRSISIEETDSTDSTNSTDDTDDG